MTDETKIDFLGSRLSGITATTALVGLGGALLFAQACEDGGLTDDDDTPRLDNDDDDAGADDDDASSDDDDAVTPDGIPIGGIIGYQPNDGVVPPGDVRGGLFPASFDKTGAEFGDEWHSDLVAAAKTSLAAGQATFAYYLPETLPAEALTPIPDVEGASSAIFAPFVYVDGNGGGGFDAGDTLLSGSPDWVLYLEAEDPEDLPPEFAGAGQGWNLVRNVVEQPEITHHPTGVNSSQGMELRVRLLAVTGGDVPVATDMAFPDGSQIAAWHGTVSGLVAGDVPADPVQFVTTAANSLRDPLIDWPIQGMPPGDHIVDLPSALLSDTVAVPDLTGAVYSQVGWVDDGDATYDEASLCDLLIAEGNKTLAWVTPPGQNLGLAFSLGVVLEQRPGWMLVDTRPRRLSAGLALSPVEGIGDDDDSAGETPYDLPSECFGDDDDSAGDDDDSAL